MRSISDQSVIEEQLTTVPARSNGESEATRIDAAMPLADISIDLTKVADHD